MFKLIKRLLFWEFVFIIAGGLALHYHIEIPWITDWFGFLKGDIVVVSGKALIYLPVVSALILSGAVSLLLYLLRI